MATGQLGIVNLKGVDQSPQVVLATGQYNVLGLDLGKIGNLGWGALQSDGCPPCFARFQEP
jgi:hypothetical protein